ncbi:hypothetical protein ABIB40_001395 [Pedobacter sp. UYP30]|uniref:hypothetical protein n=1 Tax=Pedobacter sp. UYP30 TaxID=1756400 RepID=UPI003391DFF8
MKTWHVKSHNILLSGDGANTNSLTFNGLWVKFEEKGSTLYVQANRCSFIDTVTARGVQGNVNTGEIIRSDRTISKVFGKLKTTDLGSQKNELLNLSMVQGLFPQGVRNFNNLIYNIKSYNKVHFDDGGNYYNDRKGYGKKYVDNAFTLGSTGPLLGGVLASAGSSLKIAGILGATSDIVSLYADVSFSHLYSFLVEQSTKKPVVIVDFDNENDSLRDATGHVIRAFSRHIIDKRDEKISDDNIFEAMYHSIADYLDGYFKTARSRE